MIRSKSRNNIKGQLSIELIIILAILLGVVFLVASKMRESAEKASSSIQNTSDKIYGQIEQTTNISTSKPSPPTLTSEISHLYQW
ncbi:MAG: hypothetical protein QXT72_00315 [Candidatus Micrarchaeia archaeon]